MSICRQCNEYLGQYFVDTFFLIVRTFPFQTLRNEKYFCVFHFNWWHLISTILFRFFQKCWFHGGLATFKFFQVVWETDLQKLYCVYCTLLCHSFSHCFLIICEINRTKVKREQHSAAQRRNTKWKNTPLWAHKYPNTRSTLDVMSNIYGIISNIIKISWGFWETINVKKNVSNNHKR